MGNYYKRYIYKNGVKLGPYYYSNKKVNGKVISTYLGTKEPTKFNFKVNPINKKIVIVFLSLVSVALMIYIAMNMGLFGTGQSIVDSGTTGIIGSVPGEEVIPAEDITPVEIVNDSNLTVEEIVIEGRGKPTEEIPEVITKQGQATINSQVEWSKEVKLKKEGPARVQVPSQATDIVVYSVDEQGNKQEVSDTNVGVTAQASSEIVLKGEEPAIVSFFKKIISFFKKIFNFLTGNVVTVSESEGIKEVVINENKNKYEVNYKTPGPTVTEEETDNGKKVTVSSPSGLQYENVVVYTNIESLGVYDEGSISIYWVEGEEYVEYTNIDDTNENGILDYLEWISPSADNQTYEIIVITRAEHLDSNRIFISDVYNEVRDLDDVFTEEIPDGDYVRVTFEKNLTSENDITIFPKIGSGNPRIEVYEENGNEIIAEFVNIVDNEYNKVLLVNLQNSQDTFDLKIVGGSVFFDHVVDPVAQPGGAADLRAQTCARQSLQTNQDTFDLLCLGTYPNSCGFSSDRLSCDDSISETALSNKQGATTYWAGVRITSYNSLITNCGSIDQVFLCYDLSGLAKNHACNVGVDADGGSSWSNININCLAPISGIIPCIDATSYESWSCSNFFGSSGTRALGKIQVLRNGGAGQQTWNFDVLFFNVTYSEAVPNSPPTIPFIQQPLSDIPLESGVRTINFEVRVADTNGVSDINNSSVKVNFTKSGEPTRYGDCSWINNIDANTANYSCSIGMQYYDKDGAWNISVNATDLAGSVAVNNTAIFTYGLLKAIVITFPAGSLSWSTLNPGSLTPVSSDNDPNVIRNTGNYEGSISINAKDLIGQTNPLENIPASNFRAGPTLDSECTATSLQNGVSVPILGTNLPRGVSATEEIYYCLTSVPYVSSQAYSATGANAWVIQI